MKNNKFDKEDTYYCDYPTEPIGNGNPYHCCSACKRSDPQINGKLSGHFDGCEWLLNKVRELEETEYNKTK